MAKPFPPTTGPDQPHLRKLEEMGAEKYFLRCKKRKSMKDFLYEQGAHIEGRPCPETKKKYYIKDSRFDEMEAVNYGNVLNVACQLLSRHTV